MPAKELLGRCFPARNDNVLNTPGNHLAQAGGPVDTLEEVWRPGAALYRLLKLAATAAKLETAVLWLTQNGKTRAVASNGFRSPYHIHHRGAIRAVDGFQTVVAISDPASLLGIHSTLAASVLGPINSFISVPIPLRPGVDLTLTLFDELQRPAFCTADIKLISDIGNLIKSEFLLVESQVLRDNFTIPFSLPELVNCVEFATRPVVLLNEHFQIIANSKSVLTMGQSLLDGIFGLAKGYNTTGMTGSLAYFLEYAVEHGSSTPRVEIIATPQDGHRDRQILEACASPVRPIKHDSTFFYVTLDEVAQPYCTARPVSNSQRVGLDNKLLPPSYAANPMVDLLFDTLVERRSIRARNGINYMSLRSWRQNLRDFQMKALKELKKSPGSSSLPRLIGAEIAAEINSLLGQGAFSLVVPVPCGHSKSEACLSVEIARSVGHSLNLPVVQAFARHALSGSSHPKKNLSRPPLELIRQVGGSILLVDDVATSGTHLAEAANLLRPHAKSVLPLAWIGGDSAAET